MRVFIVYDSSVVRERLVAMLSELSEIEIIGQGASPFSAIDAIPILNPDVVILDVFMPGVSTVIYVVERIRSARNAPAIIILSNSSYEPYRKRCLDAGAAFFLDKSTELERVPEALMALLPSVTRPPVDRN